MSLDFLFGVVWATGAGGDFDCGLVANVPETSSKIFSKISFTPIYHSNFFPHLDRINRLRDGVKVWLLDKTFTESSSIVRSCYYLNETYRFRQPPCHFLHCPMTLLPIFLRSVGVARHHRGPAPVAHNRGPAGA